MEYAFIISMAMTSLVSSCWTSGVKLSFQAQLCWAEIRAQSRKWPSDCLIFEAARISFRLPFLWQNSVEHMHICSFSVVLAIYFSYFVGSYYILVPCKLHCFEVPQDFQPLRNTHSTHSKQNCRTGFVGAVKLLGLWVTGTPCHFDGLKSGPDK